MTLQIGSSLELPSTVRTPMWPSVAVCLAYMRVQVAGLPETPIAQRTLVRFLAGVDSHVRLELLQTVERLVTVVALEQFLSAVHAAVHRKVRRLREPSGTNATLKRFLTRMTSPMFQQLTATHATFATLRALVRAGMNIHMLIPFASRRKAFLALRTCVQVVFSVSFDVNVQVLFRCKPFITHSTQMRSWLVITWSLDDIVTISFDLHLKCLTFHLHSTLYISTTMTVCQCY